MAARVFIDLHVVISKTTLPIDECAVGQLFELLNAEGFESKNLRARNERAVYVKERIVRGRANQPEISSFDIRQKNVLLRLVEVMDLVNEQNRLSP